MTHWCTARARPLGPATVSCGSESWRWPKSWSGTSCTVNGSVLACAQGGIVLACSIFTNIVTPSYQQIASLQAEGRVCETQSYCVPTNTLERVFCLHGDQITSSGHTLCARMPRVNTFTKRSHTFLWVCNTCARRPRDSNKTTLKLFSLCCDHMIQRIELTKK